jgi:hypothetical protein
MRITASASAPVSFTLGHAGREGRERVEDTLRRADHEMIRVRVEERQFRPRARHTTPAPTAVPGA